MAIWALLAGLAVPFLLAFALHADLSAPKRSRLTANTSLEVIAAGIYRWAFQPLWQAMPGCAQFDDELVYVPRPGAARFQAAEFDTIITMTPQGLRHQPGTPPSPGRGPVVVLGDSFAMGWGANDEETFSAVLAARHGRPTINAAVSSYGTARELLRLRRLGLLRGASMLVIQFCANDGPENAEFLRDPQVLSAGHGQALAWREINRYRPRDISFFSVLQETLHYFRTRAASEPLGALAKSLVTQRRPAIGASRPDWGPAAKLAADFLAVLDRFPELAGKPVLVTEINDRAGRTGILAELEKQARDRPNLRTVPLHFEPEDFFRFDQHLTVRGNVSVAAQLHRAIQQFEPSAP